MATEYNVWLVTGDHLSGPHREREAAERQADKFRSECPCGSDEECENDDMFPHGVSVSTSVDGYYVR